MEKNKHLTADDRKYIEEALNHKMSYASIAQALGKDPTTIPSPRKMIGMWSPTIISRAYFHFACLLYRAGIIDMREKRMI